MIAFWFCSVTTGLKGSRYFEAFALATFSPPLLSLYPSRKAFAHGPDAVFPQRELAGVVEELRDVPRRVAFLDRLLQVREVEP